MTPCSACERLAAAKAGPDLIAELPQSLLLLGDHQAYPGYAVLWSKVHAKELHQLEASVYAAFCTDLRRASAAVERASGCAKLNTAILGNQVPHLHVHLFPRSSMDPERLEHPWIHAASFKDPGTPQQRQAMIARIREALADS